ncbi:Elongation factor 3 [Bienertia sinuspersici]
MLESLNNRISALEKVNPNKNKDLETMVHRLTGPYFYHESSGFDLDPATQLPETFSTSNLPKFKPTDDPRFHLKGFRATMSIKGIDPILYPKIFPLSLDPICQKWFFSLDEKDTATWEDIAHSFMTRQKEKEGFTTYLARWKETAAQLITTPPENEMVKIFISSLLPKYRNHLRYLGLESFDKVYHIGVEIEKDFLKGSNKNDKDGVPRSCVNSIETNQQRPKNKCRQYTPLGMSQEQAFDYLTAEGVLEPIEPTLDPVPHRRTKWWNANKYYRKMVQWIADQYKHHESYESDNKINLPNGVPSVHLNVMETSKNAKENDAPNSSKGIFAGALSPIGPIADPPAERNFPRWDPNKYCKYHQGMGHDTEECWTLKSKLQDMVDDGRLLEILTINKED